MTDNNLFSTADIKEIEPTQQAAAIRIEKDRKKKMVLGKRFDTVVRIIGTPKMGETIHYVSMGQWSAHDVLIHLLNITGPAHIMIATWSIREEPANLLIKALRNGKIKTLRAIFDWRTKVRCPEAFEMCKFTFADVRLGNCHAKVTTIKNDKWAISIVGSANYTNNPRIECGVISFDKEVTAFHSKWLTEVINNCEPFEEKKQNTN